MIQGSIDDANFAALAESMKETGKTTDSVIKLSTEDLVSPLEIIGPAIEGLETHISDLSDTLTKNINNVITELTAIESKLDIESLVTVQNDICEAINNLKEEN